MQLKQSALKKNPAKGSALDLQHLALLASSSLKTFTSISSSRDSSSSDSLFDNKSSKNANSNKDTSKSDFARLGRRLIGKSIGLVLGGGGARGMSHIGIIRAFEEADIPIDIIGGTSIGSFIGGLYARDNDHVALLSWSRKFAKAMSNIFLQLFDLTYPVTAMFTGRGFNMMIKRCFGEVQIEDLLIPYFCVTTNITQSRMEIHRHGPLWKFVRASMSLSGYMPPVCDNGNLLLDGGYVNNLPGDVMRNLGANIILAVDVGSEDDKSPVNYGESLSGWWLLWKRWAPFAKRENIPTIADIQSRLAYVTCVRNLEDVKHIEGFHYLRPPVEDFGLLEFNRIDEICQVGVRYGKEIVAKWKESDLLKAWLVIESSASARPGHQRRFSI